MKIFIKIVAAALAFSAPALHAAHHEGGHGEGHSMPKAEGTRAVVAAIEAEIVAIDLETKEVTLVGPQGQPRYDRCPRKGRQNLGPSGGRSGGRRIFGVAAR